MNAKKNGDLMTVYLSGEIDQCAAEKLRSGIESLLEDRSIMRLKLDFSRVTFMDSSGVGMIIGRYKTMKSRGGTLSACGLHPPVDILFRMAGLHRIIAEEEMGRREEG